MSRKYEHLVFDYGGTLTHCPAGVTPCEVDPLFTGKVLADYLAAKGHGQFDPQQLNDLASVVSKSLPGEGQVDFAAITQRLVRWAQRIYSELGIATALLCECEELAHHYRYQSLRVRSGEIPAVNKQTLAQLRDRGYRLSMLSNNDGYVEDRLIREGVRQLFDVVVDSARHGLIKPDPQIFALTQRMLAAKAQQCLYVGDTYSADVCGAAAAGWDVAHIQPPDFIACDGPKATYVLSGLADLLQVLP